MQDNSPKSPGKTNGALCTNAGIPNKGRKNRIRELILAAAPSLSSALLSMAIPICALGTGAFAACTSSKGDGQGTLPKKGIPASQIPGQLEISEQLRNFQWQTMVGSVAYMEIDGIRGQFLIISSTLKKAPDYPAFSSEGKTHALFSLTLLDINNACFMDAQFSLDFTRNPKGGISTDRRWYAEKCKGIGRNSGKSSSLMENRDDAKSFHRSRRGKAQFPKTQMGLQRKRTLPKIRGAC
jgi:hypothetical protein